MQILQVIPITKSIDTEVLTYFSAKSVQPGMLVTVPLRKQKIQALVVESDDVTNMKTQLRGASYQIRNIIDIHDERIFSKEFLATVSLLKNYYVTTTGRMIDHIIPRIITRVPQEFALPLFQENIQSSPLIPRHLLLQQPTFERMSYYRILLRENFLKKKSIHIFCPTQESVIRIHKELSKNNTGKVFLFHGSMTKKNILKNFATLKKITEASCIISTPGFIDIYQHKLETIIIEEESSEYYNTVSEPFLDYRIIIEQFARLKKTTCVWADSILRPETYVRIQKKTAESIEPFTKHILDKNNVHIIHNHTRNPQKQNDAERIQELVEKDKEYNFFHHNVEKDLKNALRKKQKIFVFVPRKSLAPTIVCRDCGNLARSSESGFPYSLFIKNKERIFLCQRTGEQIPAFDTCQFCQSWKLSSFGIGTETVQEYFVKYFPKITTFIVDSVHAKTKKYIREVQEVFAQKNKAVVIIGTQKAIPLFSKYDMSILLGLDVFFSRMNYATHSILLKRILDISEKSTQITLQTRNILEKFLPILTHGMYPPFIDEELKQRKIYHYPPFSTLIKIIHSVPHYEAKQEYKKIYQYYEKYDPQIVAQPAPKKYVNIIVILSLDLDTWNIHYQDPLLYERLKFLDRKTKIYINPTDLY